MTVAELTAGIRASLESGFGEHSFVTRFADAGYWTLAVVPGSDPIDPAESAFTNVFLHADNFERSSTMNAAAFENLWIVANVIASIPTAPDWLRRASFSYDLAESRQAIFRLSDSLTAVGNELPLINRDMARFLVERGNDAQSTDFRGALGGIAVAQIAQERYGAAEETLKAGLEARFTTLPGPSAATPVRFVVVTGMNYAKFHGDDRIVLDRNERGHTLLVTDSTKMSAFLVAEARRLADACAEELRRFTLGDGISADN